MLTVAFAAVNVALSHRICKEEVIADFYNEVKKIETLKLQSGSQPGFLREMETFLMVKGSSFVPPSFLLRSSCVPPAFLPCSSWLHRVPLAWFLSAVSQRAEAKLADVECLIRELSALNGAVAEYFCEDPATFKLDECCSIFHSFCKRFDAAVQVINVVYVTFISSWLFFFFFF